MNLLNAQDLCFSNAGLSSTGKMVNSWMLKIHNKNESAEVFSYIQNTDILKVYLLLMYHFLSRTLDCLNLHRCWWLKHCLSSNTCTPSSWFGWPCVEVLHSSWCEQEAMCSILHFVHLHRFIQRNAAGYSMIGWVILYLSSSTLGWSIRERTRVETQ